MKKFLLTSTLALFALTVSHAVAADDADKKRDRLGLEPEALFKKLDANNDSKLTKDEFAKVIEEIRAKGEKAGQIADRLKDKVDEIFAKLDEDKNGNLNLEETKKFDVMTAVGRKSSIQDLEATFKKLDANNDSKLTKEEFLKVIDELAAGNADKAAKLAEKVKPTLDGKFGELDADKNDTLNLEEFKKFNPLGERKKKPTSTPDFTFIAAKAKKGATDLDAAFKKLDMNNDGKLSKDEFAKVSEKTKKKKKAVDAAKVAKKATKSKGEIDEAFTKLATDKDGSLSLEEFKKYEAPAKKKKKA